MTKSTQQPAVSKSAPGSARFLFRVADELGWYSKLTPELGVLASAHRALCPSSIGHCTKPVVKEGSHW